MRIWPWVALVAAGAAACGGDKAPRSEELVVPDKCDGRESGVACEDGVALTCEAGDIVAEDDCAARGMGCNSTRGCEICRPQYYSCDGNKLMVCSDDGGELTFVKECTDGMSCSPLGCRDLCEDARTERSYLGCEYWPVITLNSFLDPAFEPALVVGNPALVSARVTVTKAGEHVAQIEVPPGSARTITLDLTANDPLRSAAGSTLVREGAYHLVSSVPVMVHQFNPLLYQVDRDCEIVANDRFPMDGKCNSYTNDASLLLPAHVLAGRESGGTAYLGVSRTSFMFAEGPGAFAGASGFLALVGVGEAPVNVTLRSSAHTRPELEDSDAGVPALAPGDSYSLRLGPGDVLQLLSQVPGLCEGTEETVGSARACDPGRAYDLTGTFIEADGPLQLIGGHDCTYVPFDEPACDHLEETIFPLETWGKRVIVGQPRESAGGLQEREGALYMLRVVSGADDNTIRFEPAVTQPVTLQQGEFHELLLDGHVQVVGNKPLVVAQYLLGQSASSEWGDPSLTLVPPVEQYRSNYNFLSPETYSSNFVTVIAPEGETVVLDGNTLATSDFDAIGNTGYGIATKPLDEPGDHEVHSESGAPIGISLYGFGQYTSYMLPGGLDLRVIADTF